MTPESLIDQGRVWLIGHYPDYWNLPDRERRILAVAWLCDVVKPREKTGHNDGEVVEAILNRAGAKKGDPWCAAAQLFAADVAKVWRPQSGGAAVLSWEQKFRETKNPIRGDMCVRDRGNGKRHIGCVLKRILGLVYSIEGNTSPGEEGSQRDGQGMYRRVRLKSFWDKFYDGS